MVQIVQEVGEQGVLARRGYGFVEGDVQLLERIDVDPRVVDGGRECVLRSADRLDVDGGAVGGGEPRSQLVEGTSDVQELHDLGAMSLHPTADRIGIGIGTGPRDEATPPLLDVDEPDRLEGADRFSDADATDAEELAELAFGRQAVTGRVVALADGSLQLGADLFGAVHALDGMERPGAGVARRTARRPRHRRIDP